MTLNVCHLFNLHTQFREIRLRKVIQHAVGSTNTKHQNSPFQAGVHSAKTCWNSVNEREAPLILCFHRNVRGHSAWGTERMFVGGKGSALCWSRNDLNRSLGKFCAAARFDGYQLWGNILIKFVSNHWLWLFMPLIHWNHSGAKSPLGH